MRRIWRLMLLPVLLSGCGSGGDYCLILILPKDAKSETGRIRVAVVEPGASATCPALVVREAVPGDAGYGIEEEISFDYPVTGAKSRLEGLGPGRRLFYAEGLDSSGAVIVNGCTAVEAGAGGPGRVTIELGRITVCFPTNQGVEICDGRDNDCDGGTDNLPHADLCPPLTGTDAGECVDGACVYTCRENWFNANADWSDGCECRYSRGGVEWCDGRDNDCDGEIDPPGCIQCSTDADCTNPQGCLEGQCTGGVCSAILATEGAPCDDGLRCTENDACDGAGNCLAEPIPGYCASHQECQPACAQDEFGCVNRPSGIILDCPQANPRGQPAVCAITLQGNEDSIACARCGVRLLPSTVSNTKFYDYSTGCSPGGWQLEADGCADGPSYFCPLGAGEPGRYCCTTTECDPDKQALRFSSSASCADEGSRLAQLFSLDTFESIRVCYQITQNTLSAMQGILQLMADKNDQSAPIVLNCDDPQAWHHDTPTMPCVDLPLTIADWPQTRLTFWVEPGGGGDEIFLAGAAVYAFPRECSRQLTVIDTSFDGCGAGAAGHDGWTFSPAGTCADSEAECGFSGGLLVGTLGSNTVGSVSAHHVLEMAGARAPARLCWKHYHTAGFAGRYVIALGNLTRAWYVPIYESRFPDFALRPVCRELCVDLDFDGDSLFRPGHARLIIYAQATSGYLLINDVRLEASQACDAAGIFQIGDLEPDGQGGYQVRVDNLPSLPRRALLECSWGDGIVKTSKEIEFVTP